MHHASHVNDFEDLESSFSVDFHQDILICAVVYSLLFCFFFISYIIKFLAKLAVNSDRNKMSSSNIAIVIGPNLLWPPGDNGWEPKSFYCFCNVLLINKTVKQPIDYLSFAFLSGKMFQSMCFGNLMETQRTFVENRTQDFCQKTEYFFS